MAPLAVVVAEGSAYTVTVTGDDTADPPEAAVTVTVYVPDEPVVMDCVVAPVFHRYAVPLFADSVTELPWQNDVDPEGVIVATGVVEFTETFTGADVLEQPLALVTLTVYDPAVLTEIEDVVCPPGVHR